MRNNFYGHDEDVIITKDKTHLVEIPISLALEVHAFLTNRESRDVCKQEPSYAYDPRLGQLPQMQTLTERFAQEITQSYTFERNNNSVLMKKLEEEVSGHEGTKQLFKALKEAPMPMASCDCRNVKEATRRDK